MALTLTQDQIKILISLLEKSSTPVPTTDLVTALKS
ncbi:hypothetical protein BH24CHL1_BH24CHL1_12950 [soil metagenome]